MSTRTGRWIAAMAIAAALAGAYVIVKDNNAAMTGPTTAIPKGIIH